MDINVINECSELSLAGKITFPEVVMKLIAAGTERYIADLIALEKFYYGKEDEIYTTLITFDAPIVVANFDVTGIKSAIADIQQNRINYKEFLNRIMSAGCCHYEVFLTGKKAIYFGRDGSHHIEHFPGSNP